MALVGTECQEWDFSNENLTLYVFQIMGPRCLSWLMILLTEIIYTIILVSGVVGNLVTCFVIVREKSMHVPTNYYLFSLAVSDFLSLIMGLPFELLTARYAQWPYELPELVCKTRAYVSELTTYASVLTITAFSFERWIAICFPLKIQAFSKFRRAVRVIAVVWLIAIGSAFPVFYSFHISELDIPDWVFEQKLNSSAYSSNNRTLRDTSYCYLDSTAEVTLISASFWIFFLLPMSVILVLYSHIAIVIRRSSKQTKAPNSRKHSKTQTKSHRASVRMLMAVVLAFFICYLPFHIQRLSSIYSHSEGEDSILALLWAGLFYISGFFYYSNSALNPLIYNLLNAKFRRALHSSFLCLRQRQSEFLQNSLDGQSQWTKGLSSAFASDIFTNKKKRFRASVKRTLSSSRLLSITVIHKQSLSSGSQEEKAVSDTVLVVNTKNSPSTSGAVSNGKEKNKRKNGCSSTKIPKLPLLPLLSNLDISLNAPNYGTTTNNAELPMGKPDRSLLF